MLAWKEGGGRVDAFPDDVLGRPVWPHALSLQSGARVPFVPAQRPCSPAFVPTTSTERPHLQVVAVAVDAAEDFPVVAGLNAKAERRIKPVASLVPRQHGVLPGLRHREVRSCGVRRRDIRWAYPQ